MRILILLIAILSMHSYCMADIIKLKNGSEFEGFVELQKNGSYFIDGVTFTEDEIANIKIKELSEEYGNPEGRLTKVFLHYKIPKEVWYGCIINLFGIKTEYQKKEEASKEKRQKALALIRAKEKKLNDNKEKIKTIKLKTTNIRNTVIQGIKLRPYKFINHLEQ